MVPDTLSEAQAVDSMTHAMLSSSMLLVFSQVVFSERRDDLTVGQFFDSFMKTHQSNRFRPFNEGVIRGMLLLADVHEGKLVGSRSGGRSCDMGYLSDPRDDPDKSKTVDQVFRQAGQKRDGTQRARYHGPRGNDA